MKPTDYNTYALERDAHNKRAFRDAGMPSLCWFEDYETWRIRRAIENEKR